MRNRRGRIAGLVDPVLALLPVNPALALLPDAWVGCPSLCEG
ncbi:hypothetical protein A2U01_0118320, partial [Trifolium medium]|nr:hypothetical protein [Trifolium medium]